MKKKVVVVDDHPIVRRGFIQLINQEADLDVIGEAEDAGAAREIIIAEKPDLALIDISLKDSNGLELIKDLKHLCPKVIILVVSLHDENVYAERALRAGAKGFIMKAEATENVMVAIRQVMSGGVYLSPHMRSKMLEKLTGNVPQSSLNPTEILSDREFEVYQMIGEGLKTKSIADKLNLSIKTIETYKAHLKTKLQLNDSTELIQHAVEWFLRKDYF